MLNKLFSVLSIIGFIGVCTTATLCLMFQSRMILVAGCLSFVIMVFGIMCWICTYDWGIYNKDDTNQWGD